jgi:hypothetical protein
MLGVVYLCLDRNLSAELDGLLIQNILESEQECCCEHTLGDLGSNA